MGKVKFIIESDFLKTNSIMKFAIEKGAKIEDYQQALTEAETNGVRRWLIKVRKHCKEGVTCIGCPKDTISCDKIDYLTDKEIEEIIQKVGL